MLYLATDVNRSLQKPKQLYLEFVRGTVAILVFFSHIIELLPFNDSAHPFLISYVGTDSVMIFFLLSGCVINMSQTRRPKSKMDFFVNRMIRLYPQFILGVASALIAWYILKKTTPSLEIIFGNLFMLSTLQGYVVRTIPTNNPVWTLSFEMFFYILFLFCIGKNSKRKLWVWFFVAMASTLLYYFQRRINIEKQIIMILAFSSIWLVGYFVYEYRKYFYSGKYAALLSFGMLPIISRLHLFDMHYDPFNYFLFALMGVPFFRFCLQTEPQGFKIKTIYIVPFYPLLAAAFYFSHNETRPLSRFLYIVLPLALVFFYFLAGRLKWRQRGADLVNKIGAVTGKYSYSLYIIHYPILCLCAGFLKNRIVFVMTGIILVVLVSYLLEEFFQPAVVKFFKKGQESQPLLAAWVRFDLKLKK